jgi:hypothetical protein
MRKMTNMYDARYNLAEQAQGLINKGGWARFKALNPKAAKTITVSGKAGLGAGALGTVWGFLD